ncbi:MAG: hypothetical protein U0798_14960 [Gemmataceae bacterium]
MLRAFSLGFAWMILCAQVNAQSTIVGFDFTGQTGTQTTFNATTVQSGLTVAPITRSSSLSTNARTNSFGSLNWTNGTSITNTSTDTYVQFSFSTDAFSQVQIGSFTADLIRGGNGPKSAQFAYNLNNSGFINGSAVNTIPNASAVTTASEVFASPLVVGPNSTIDIRLYGYSANNLNSTDTMDLLSTAPGSNAFAVIGFYTPVPEPTSLIALSCTEFATLGFRLLRKKKQLKNADAPVATV